MMLIYFSVEVLLTAVVTAMFPTPWTPVLWEAAEWEVAFIMTIAGGFQGCLDPLFVELAAEVCLEIVSNEHCILNMVCFLDYVPHQRRAEEL